jgi:hypothetical protein
LSCRVGSATQNQSVRLGYERGVGLGELRTVREFARIGEMLDERRKVNIARIQRLFPISESRRISGPSEEAQIGRAQVHVSCHNCVLQVLISDLLSPRCDALLTKASGGMIAKLFIGQAECSD